MPVPGEVTYWRLLVVFNVIFMEKAIYEIRKIELSLFMPPRCMGGKRINSSHY